MITVALSKGRLFKSMIQYLKDKEAFHYVEALSENDRSLYTEVDNVRFIFAKGKDVPVYVEKGICDLGIVGLDILKEEPVEVLNVSKLPFGFCHMTVAGPPGVEKIERVATSFTNIAFEHFNAKRQDIQLIHLNGSVELAPILDLADVIVDIVQTGTTLKENGLIEYEKILDIQARLIANKQTFYLKEEEIYHFMKEIGVF
jgi:ATP phosphoribosyltransferase